MSNNLTGSTIASTYNQLLHIDGGPTATEKVVYSGTGTPTALKVGTGSVAVDNVRLNGSTVLALSGDLVLSASAGQVAIADVAITGGSILGITPLGVAEGGTGASTVAAARTALGLGSLALQAADAINVTGGTITGTFAGSVSGMTLLSGTTVTGVTTINGGNLRLSGNSLNSTNTNGNIVLAPDNAGVVITDNLSFDGNTIASTNTDGDINLTPNGTGSVIAPKLRATGSLGYGTGAGGTVTQITSKSTAVTINKLSGTITTHNESMNGATIKVFTVNNSLVEVGDVPLVCLASGGTAGEYGIAVDAVAAGSFKIRIYHDGPGGALAEALVLNFVVVKGVSA